MRFLTVADRELRSAARQKATYRTRWLTAALFFGLLVWLLWALNGFANRRAVPEIFKVLSVLTLLYCLFLGTALTSDCISAERREGTLGFLFLTNLNSAEIIAHAVARYDALYREALEAVREQNAYFRKHEGHMDYAANAALGVPIGSGSVESLCSQFQNRLKRTGQFWTKEGFAALLTIIVRHWNGELDSLWQAEAA